MTHFQFYSSDTFNELIGTDDNLGTGSGSLSIQGKKENETNTLPIICVWSASRDYPVLERSRKVKKKTKPLPPPPNKKTHIQIRHYNIKNIRYFSP